jgi:hypothetical protein
MGTATLLSHVQTVCQELGFALPTGVIAATDAQTLQMLALANREGKEASVLVTKNGCWQALRKSFTITLIASTPNYALPADLNFAMVKTAWDVNFKWQLLGPLSPQEWDVLVYGISPVGPRRRYRIINGQFSVNPTPSAADAGNQLAFEYVTNKWCQSNAAVGQTAFAADTDTYLLDDDMMQLGIKWRFLRAKGLDYMEEKEAWERQRDLAISGDGFSRDLPINSTASGVHLLGEANVPDTGFGS